ncbi:hypothetical protein [Flagellimonas sp.]|uniref:TlpA family protein disulfide reductase n=1 Tax=Flagellimonas sp. TaxID=2058762 RepID=UPI003B5292CE
MKKTVLLLGFLLSFLPAKSQLIANLKELRQDKTVSFDQVISTYNLNQDNPTVFITWSGKWCMPCVQLIDLYNQCDSSMINLVTINVDTDENRPGVLEKGYDQKWNNAINLRGNLGPNDNGFGNVFNVSLAPLVIYVKNGNIEEILTGYYQYPYRLISSGKINNVNLIWNSYTDLNSLAWTYYKDKTDPSQLEKALRWVNRSMELDKNYYNTDTYASLLFKTGEYTKALKAAKEAIEIAKANDIKHVATTELINQIIEKL